MCSSAGYAQRNNNNGRAVTPKQQTTTASGNKSKAQQDAARRQAEAKRQEQARQEELRREQEEAEKRNALRWEESQKALYFRGNIIYEMVSVEGGAFIMGATQEQVNARDDEKPAHTVNLSSYYIGRSEVPQALWQAVMNFNPSNNVGDNLPVECVSWDDCQVFIQRLNALTGCKFRLPTEAEWEYAARGGWKSGKKMFSGSNTANEIAWYKENADGHTHNVMELDPVPDLIGLLHVAKHQNELGLYDMCGNVLEWCSDWYGNYESTMQANPQGPSSGTHRVLRGGCCISEVDRCRVSSRSAGTTDLKFDYAGLRLAFSY